MKRALPLLLLSALWASGCSPANPGSGYAVPTTSTERASTDGDAEVKTVVLALTSVQKTLSLTGQVNPTEHGRADVTTPLQGIVIEPLVKVGERVDARQPLANINNVYGQTTMQLTQKVEADQAAVLSAQTALQQAVSTLGQARTALAQAETTASQAEDNSLQAQAEMTNAQVDHRRKQEGFKVGVSAQSDVDDAKERYLKAQAVVVDARRQVGIAQRAVDIARRNIAPSEETVRLARHNIDIAQRQVEHDQVIAQGALNPVGSSQTQFQVRSPIAGVVIAVNMSAGLAVSPGTVLASVVNTRQVYVDANAYQEDLQGVHQGDPMTVQTDAFPGQQFRGRVSYIGKQVDPNSRTVNVRCLIENPRDQLRPGLYVDAVLANRSPRQAVVVPNQAILIADHDPFVMVEDKPGHYERRKITAGVRTENDTEVLNGLQPGERVVTQGNLLVVPP